MENFVEVNVAKTNASDEVLEMLEQSNQAGNVKGLGIFKIFIFYFESIINT